jgi:hypothetical protein
MRYFRVTRIPIPSVDVEHSPISPPDITPKPNLRKSREKE